MIVIHISALAQEGRLRKGLLAFAERQRQAFNALLIHKYQEQSYFKRILQLPKAPVIELNAWVMRRVIRQNTPKNFIRHPRITDA